MVAFSTPFIDMVEDFSSFFMAVSVEGSVEDENNGNAFGFLIFHDDKGDDNDDDNNNGDNDENGGVLVLLDVDVDVDVDVGVMTNASEKIGKVS